MILLVYRHSYGERKNLQFGRDVKLYLWPSTQFLKLGKNEAFAKVYKSLFHT